MQVTLMGPDDLGRWYFADHDGNSFPFITRHEDHPNAAAMLGWQRPEGINDEVAILNALKWLMDHTGEDFTAPPHVTVFFRQLNEGNKT